ncbi:hypothetical protein [Leptolyngbya sp. FACHB-711]|uniref:hypothetical protein n=1 Tax=unclassified Leptolyngbya TaxID=2650499 RepID=UPI0016835C17|nr:hypothetical protein [Leptolyngbya sp. FACHB-711]MBD1849421.1 hypothetical protein [Cyanobacteria bacterium FACHB-502]MBD2024111.1 hypothetical protein [Leptolyngbya sp. FACHB-711]
MFMDELTPVIRELAGHPIAFLGGFVSGLLRLNLADDPVKSWLEQQSGVTLTQSTPSNQTNGNGNGPQQISID